MAIALSLLVEIFDLLQRAVNWLGGVSDAQAGASGASGAAQHAGEARGSSQGLSQGQSQAQQPQRTQPQRIWGGPLRLHPTRRAARARSGRGTAQHARW